MTSIIDDKCYAVVNVNTFENVDRSELDSSVADFDGEDLDVRLARRSQFWIANVTVRGG